MIPALRPGHTAPNPIKMYTKSLTFKIHMGGHTAAITISLSLKNDDNDFRIAF